MDLVWDVLGAGAILILLALLYLLLFERGTSYRMSSPVYHLEDAERFRTLTALLAVPPLPIHSLRVLREGAGLYAPQIEAIRVAQRSVHLEAYIFDRANALTCLLMRSASALEMVLRCG
jgi:hypothetical protein